MAISDRLLEFAKTKYGDRHGYKSLFAKDLGISSSQLTQYVSGSLLPGNKIQQKLRDLGCDIEWLMTGRRLITYGDQTIVGYDLEPIGVPNSAPGQTEKTNNVEKLTEQVEELQRLIAALRYEIQQKNDELADKKKIIALLEDKILTIGVTLGNESSSTENPVQVLQKIK